MKDQLYIQRLVALLRMEHDAERDEYRMQMSEMSLARRIRRGICWYPVVAVRNFYNSLNQLCVEIVRQTKDGEDEVEHNFEYGRPVVFETLEGNSTAAKNQTTRRVGRGGGVCQISYVDGNRMVVVVTGIDMALALQSAGEMLVQLYFDETSYKAMYAAMDEVTKAKPESRLGQLRGIFAGGIRAERFTFGALTFPYLNDSQQKAVNEVLWAKDVAVVHGPPGTGKTTTLVEAIYETLRRETQVMVCAQSNTAVDWISEKLVDHGIPVLRIGNPTRVNDKMLSFTYERKFEAHNLYPELWTLRKTIRQIREGRKNDNVHQKLSRLRERADEIEMTIRQDIMSEARVIACTLVGASNRLLIGQKFSTLFIDEAAQALEPACWIAIRRAHRVVLAGDHCQLPPTVKCFEAMREGLGKTLMERIVENVPQCVTLLSMQYRMNERIMKFPSEYFYDNRLVSSAYARERRLHEFDEPIEWVESGDGGETFVSETHGRINREEAAMAVSRLEAYIERIGRQRFIDEHIDIGLISPYRMQIQLLQKLVKQSEILKPLRRHISINTVDGFQGQERDVIMISLVRSNNRGEIGFLSDLRRMNVAMTRARMKLIILGNYNTLSNTPFYKRLYEYITENL